MQITKVARKHFESRNDVTRARLEIDPKIGEVTKHEYPKFVNCEAVFFYRHPLCGVCRGAAGPRNPNAYCIGAQQSIPQLISEDVGYWKPRYLSWIDGLGKSPYEDSTLVDTLLIRP